MVKIYKRADSPEITASSGFLPAPSAKSHGCAAPHSNFPVFGFPIVIRKIWNMCDIFANDIGKPSSRNCYSGAASHALRQLPGNSRSESGALHKERPDGHSLLASGYRWCAGSEKAANSACASFAAKSMNGRPLFASERTIRHIPSLTRLIRKIFRPLVESVVPILPHAVKGLR